MDREFKLKKGSTITWNGDPYLGDLGDANYEVPGGANLLSFFKIQVLTEKFQLILMLI